MVTHTVLLIEPDAECAERLTAALEAVGHTTWVRPTAACARDLLSRSEPDLVILDLQLPDEDGLGLCASLRASSDVPIIVRGVGLDGRSVVEALRRGADDVLREPCEPEELLARFEAVMRRAKSKGTAVAQPDVALRAGSLTIDQSRCRVMLAGQPVSVTPSEYRLLVALARQPGRLVTREELDRVAWGARGPTRDGRRIDVCVHRLRQRLGLAGDVAGVPWLTAVRGHGYRLVLPS
jgi:DNA-binding response OmpR family regulator